MLWMVPLNRLDEAQLAVLRACGQRQGRHEWIKGFAGSGKTVLLVHAIHRILELERDSRVCVAVFTHALKDLIRTGLQDKYEKRVPVMTYHQLLNQNERYDVIVVDEVQDIPKDEMLRIRGLADRLIVAGDADQTIYENGITPEELMGILEPRTHTLMVVYRLTRRLAEIVRTILPGSKIEAARSARMQEVQVSSAKAKSRSQETEWVWRQCRNFSKQGEPSAILLPSHSAVQEFIKEILRLEGKPMPAFPRREGRGKSTDYGAANALLSKEGTPLRYLGNSYGDLAESGTRPLTYIMTYHSAKGLDFETVFLPYLDSDQAIWMNDRQRERSLFFVAATRSRLNLFMSYSTVEPHPLVQAMPQELLHKITCELPEDESPDEAMFF